MLNNTHELIQEISPYWNEQSDLDHFYRNTLRILNSHSERIDTALALLELVEKSANEGYSVTIGIGDYLVFHDEGDGTYKIRSSEKIDDWHKTIFCGAILECINFIKQQNATNI